jgi:hypothetical protein
MSNEHSRFYNGFALHKQRLKALVNRCSDTMKDFWVSTANLLITSYLTTFRMQRAHCFYDNESHYSNVAMRQVYETSLLEASVRDIFWDIDGDLDRIQRARVDEKDHGVFQQRAMYAVAEGQKLVDDGIYVEPTRVTAELG